MIRMLLVLAAGACLAGAMGFAQSGQVVYSKHCQMCHGANGIPNPTMGRLLGVMSVNDPAMKKLTPVEMFTAVKNGKGKMPAQKSQLTDAQIRDAIAYLRTFIKK
jgi:mono/diheme cytochrome c family protein